MKPRKFTAEQLLQANQERQEGMSYRKIKERHGISYGVLRYHFSASEAAQNTMVIGPKNIEDENQLLRQMLLKALLRVERLEAVSSATRSRQAR